MSTPPPQVVEQHPDMPGADVAAMYSALLAFSGAVYPDRLEYVDRVLQTCHNVSCQLAGLPWSWLVVPLLLLFVLQGTAAAPSSAHSPAQDPCVIEVLCCGLSILPCLLLAIRVQALQRRGPITDAKAEKQVVALLSTPLDKYDVVTGGRAVCPPACVLATVQGDCAGGVDLASAQLSKQHCLAPAHPPTHPAPPPAVLGLGHYPALMELLQPRMKREMATRIVQGLLKGGTRVASLDKVEMLFRWAWGGVGDRPSALILGVALKPQHPSPQAFPSALTCPAAALLPPPAASLRR